MDDLTNMILGEFSLWQFIGLFIFAIMGVLLHSFKDVGDRNMESPNTPKNFSFKFYYRDNIKKYIANIVALYIVLRFFPNLFGHDLSEFSAFLLGFSGDSIMTTFKKKSKTLQVDREKLMENLNNS